MKWVKHILEMLYFIVLLLIPWGVIPYFNMKYGNPDMTFIISLVSFFVLIGLPVWLTEEPEPNPDEPSHFFYD